AGRQRTALAAERAARGGGERDRLLEIDVVEEDVCGLAAEFERDVAQPGGGALHDATADLWRAREVEHVDPPVPGQKLAEGGLVGRRDDVDDSGRDLGLLGDDPGNGGGGERRRGRRFQNRGVPGRQRRRQLPDVHLEGRV